MQFKKKGNRMKQIYKRIGMLLLCIVCILFACPEEAEAASSYTDAKLYYDTCEDKTNRIEFVGGEGQERIYFANRAGVGSTAYKRFTTIGWEITMTGNGKSISMDFKIDGSYLSMVHTTTHSGYNYTLYSISYQELCKLAEIKNPSVWKEICRASEIRIRLDAIVTWKNPGSTETVCKINSESGYGTCNFSNGSYWRFSNSSDLAAAKSVFTRQTFEGYYNLGEPVPNYSYEINYYAGYTDVKSTTGYTINSTSGLIGGKDSAVQIVNRFENMILRNPVGSSSTDFGLVKTGYRIDPGKEWRTTDKTKYYNYASSHYSVDLNSAVTAYSGTKLYLVANWVPISYSVEYRGNGGVGETVRTGQTYDKAFNILQNPFYRENYVFTGWNTKADGSGVSYSVGQSVKNLTSIHGDDFILYAQWEPKIYQITIVDDFGTGGTETFYQKFTKNFSLKSDASTSITTVTVPDEVPGYTYEGVYLSINNKAEKIINENGEIVVGNTYFKENISVFAHWKPNDYTITFDQQGGINGTSSAVVTYTKMLPNDLYRPAKTGWTFKGYYTQPNGNGTMYFNEFMSTDKTCDFTKNITLYAYWVDNELPTGNLFMPTTWTNNPDGVKAEAQAEDYGSGLFKAILNREDVDGDVYINGSSSDLNGKQIHSFTHYCTKEGVYVYRFEFSDKDNPEKVVTVYKTSKYDIKAPTGEILTDKTDITDMKHLTIFAEVTDFNFTETE